MSARGEVAVGVVGCGWWATTAHLPAIRDDPRARLAGIAESDAAKRASAAGRFAAGAAFAGWEELLDAVELDALVIATPPAAHCAPAAAALERGIHVLVEKPMVVAPADGRRLVALARANGAELMVGYTWHSTPHVARLRAEIADGRIGTIEHVSCSFASTARELYAGRPATYEDGALGYAMAQTPDPATYADPAGGGGQAHTQLTHSAALALHLSGLVPARVSALTAGFELDVDLADAVAVAFHGGAIGAFDCVGSVLPGQEEMLLCRIFGRDGHVELDPMRGTASVHGRDGDVVRLDVLPEAERYPITAPARNLVGVALGTDPNRAPGLLGQQVVELIDGALRSARQGRTIDLDPPF